MLFFVFVQHCLVPHGYDVDPSFAEWIHRQRTTYISMLKEEKPSPLLQSRMEKLEEIGFNFTVHSDKWLDHWNMLKQYKEKHGDCQVPTHYAENPKLGRWTHTQRHQRRLQLKGKKSCITEERIALLDQLGFSWEVRPAMEQPRATWQQRYDELREFHQVHGHFLIPSDLYPKLHRWSLEQRSRLQCLGVSGGGTAGEANLMSDGQCSRRMGSDRIKALEEIGFTKDTALTESQVTAAATTGEESIEPGMKEEDDVVVVNVIPLAVVDNNVSAAI
jgi:Helicase associated domain